MFVSVEARPLLKMASITLSPLNIKNTNVNNAALSIEIKKISSLKRRDNPLSLKHHVVNM